MENKRLKRLMLQAVNNQLRDSATTYVKDVYDVMRDAGYTAGEAKEAIAAVLLSEMFIISGEKKKFSEERYRQGLQEMLEDYELREAEEPWPGMRDLLEAGDRELQNDFRSVSSMASWEKAWEIVKEKVKHAEMPIELYEVDEATDYEYEIEEWISEMMYAYQRMNENEKCIQFCKEVIATFPWAKARPTEFKREIGDCLLNAGKLEESDAWYDAWIRDEWYAGAAIAGAFHWMARNNYVKAEQILERILEECEGTTAYDGFYHNGAEFYRRIGNDKKATEFDKLEQEYEERMRETEEGFEDWEGTFFDGKEPWIAGSDPWYVEEEDIRQEPVVKPKKIYPNDLCPCGSGKKYKKCCGRK